MVYETDTLKICHPLTKEGEREYRLLLERKADEILFKSLHPVKYWVRRILNLVKTGDSTWDGPHYSE